MGAVSRPFSPPLLELAAFLANNSRNKVINATPRRSRGSFFSRCCRSWPDEW
jgi:hypothetical protein